MDDAILAFALEIDRKANKAKELGRDCECWRLRGLADGLQGAWDPPSKKLPVGTRLKATRSLLGPVPEDKQGRTIAKVQSNAFAMSLDHKDDLSWLYFPKAADFKATPTDTGYCIQIYEDGEIAVEYQLECVK